MVLEALLGRIQDGAAKVLHWRGPRPTVVMVHGHVITPHLSRRHLQADHLMAMLRRAGIHRVEDAELVILENRGSLTIVRAGEKIDAALLADVEGRRLVPEALIGD